MVDKQPFSSAAAVPPPAPVNKWFASPGLTMALLLLSPFSSYWPLCIIARNNAIILILYLFSTSDTIFRSVLTDSHFFFAFAPGNPNSISIIGYRLEGYFCLLIPLRQIWSDMFRSLAFYVSTNYADICYQRTWQFHTICALSCLSYLPQFTDICK